MLEKSKAGLLICSRIDELVSEIYPLLQLRFYGSYSVHRYTALEPLTTLLNHIELNSMKTCRYPSRFYFGTKAWIL